MTTPPHAPKLPELARLLALVPYLLAHPGVRFDEAAAVFGISEDRLRKDLDLLWVCGLPGHGPGDLIDLEFEGDTITLFEPAGVTRPLRLTVDEALALIVALRALADTPGLTERDALDRALTKIEGVAGDAAAAADAVHITMEGEERVLPVVQQALETGRRLHLRYHSPGRDVASERDVDPVRVRIVDGRPYLDGWCLQAEAKRTFRLDRVVSVAVLDVPAEPHELDEPAEELYVPGDDDMTVVLALRPGAEWVADYYRCDSVEDLGPDGLVVRLRTYDPSWVRRLALRLGTSARVLEPADLVADVHRSAESALAAYALD
jgi:proteasome accessory factor C